jgi:hypothetical protein
MSWNRSTLLGKDDELGHGDEFAPQAEFEGRATVFLPPWAQPENNDSSDGENQQSDPLLIGLLAVAAYLLLT